MPAPCAVLPPDLEYSNPGWTDPCEDLSADCGSVPQSGLADPAVICLLLGSAAGGQAPWTHIYVGKPFWDVWYDVQERSIRVFKTHTVTVTLLLLDKLRGEVCVDFEHLHVLGEMCVMLWSLCCC